jgi:hypothetical protein
MAIQDSIKQAVDFLNSPENLMMAEAAQTMQQVTLPDGRTINVYPDGTAQEFTSDGRVKVYNQSGDVILNQTQAEYAKPGYLSPIVNALMAAAGGLVLGPAGVGLSTPLAAAGGAGGASLFRGGSIEDALKAAALAGTLGYGIENLFPTDALTVGNTATNLAASGGTVDSITQTLVDQGVSAATARSIAAEALAGSSASQIASDFAGLTLGGAGSTSLASTAATNPNLVNVVAPATGPGLLSSVVSAAPAVIPAMLASTTTQSATQPTEQTPTEQVNVQALRQAKINDLYQSILGRAPDAAGLAFYSNPAFTEAQIEADIRNSPEAKNRVVITPPTTPPGPSVGNVIPGIVPAVVAAPAPAPGPETVEVTGSRGPINPLGPAVVATLPSIPTSITQPLPSVTQPQTGSTSLFNPADILKLLGLLGGIGAGSALTGSGSSTTSPTVLPPSDTMIGSTTPQFGPDYYAAVQQYYNTYMPQTPRNVATPLQQWYENKFGA